MRIAFSSYKPYQKGFMKPVNKNINKTTPNLSFCASESAISKSSSFLGDFVKRKIQMRHIERPEFIKFSQAQTTKEAIEFGKEILGIKKYKGFKKEDLATLNWINEGLVRINNKTKSKVTMPEKIILSPKLRNGKNSTIASMSIKKEMAFSKEEINRLIKRTDLILADINDEDFKKQAIEKIKNSNNFGSHIAFATEAASKFPKVNSKLHYDTYASPFSIISHEMGHLQHFVHLGSAFGYTAEGACAFLFQNSIETAEKVSKYAQTSPCEFVAEVFAQLVDGVKIDKEVRELYKHMGGYWID